MKSKTNNKTKRRPRCPEEDGGPSKVSRLERQSKGNTSVEVTPATSNIPSSPQLLDTPPPQTLETTESALGLRRDAPVPSPGKKIRTNVQMPSPIVEQESPKHSNAPLNEVSGALSSNLSREETK
jgi:hypothetical protein